MNTTIFNNIYMCIHKKLQTSSLQFSLYRAAVSTATAMAAGEVVEPFQELESVCQLQCTAVQAVDEPRSRGRSGGDELVTGISSPARVMQNKSVQLQEFEQGGTYTI